MKQCLRFLLVATAVAAGSLVSGPAAVDAGGLISQVVDTTSDASLTACTNAAGDCSLRGAVANNNGAPGTGHFISFSAAVFPPGAPATITIASTLTVNAPSSAGVPTTIDGTGAGVIVDGAGEPSAFDCFDLVGPNTGPITIKVIQVTDCTIGISVGSTGATIGPGNVIFDSTTGISAQSTGALIQSNFIGTNAAGTAVHPSGGNGTGISITGSSNTIGGAGALGNVISGNTASGIQISGDSNSVKGNLIGANAAGAAAIPNSLRGILITTANSDNNVIGGAGAEGNVISGNGGTGIIVGTDFGTGNTIKGNQIGTIGGNAALGNAGDGISISQKAANTLIGGTAAADRNIISGNVANGINASSGSGTVIKANYIGLGLDGSTVLANGGDGVRFTSGDGPVTVGGPTAGERNVISGNVLHGIEVSGSSNGHTIRGNYIGTDANGTLDKGNGSDGVHIEISDTTTIGGSGAGDLNVISGNTGMGLRISNEANNSVIHGNRIGTDVAGTTAISNNDGINISDSDGTFVGGSAAGQGNLISGNVDDGIEIHGTSASTRVEGNFIGTNAAGTGDLGNGANGIQQYNTSTLSQIGGASAAQRNIISGNNGTAGILMTAASNTISGNYIGLNATGTVAIPNSTGVRVSGINNTVGGLTGGSGNVISGNSDNGIEIAGQNNSIKANTIGLGANGNTDLGNVLDGILITASNNVVGGSSSVQRNVISGNDANGIEVTGAATTGIIITANYIGTDATGTLDRGNSVDGIHIDASDGNTIGDSPSSQRNVISGNNGDGINLVTDANSNTIKNNYIGTDVTGMLDRGNSAIGVNIVSSDNNIVGAAGDGNVLSGNGQDGAEISSASLGNTVQANMMGVASDGVSPLGNSTNGIQIAGTSNNTTLGGNSAALANHLAYNTGDGITISSGTGNLIDQNSIHDNGALGIDLANDNIVTPNDVAPDADAGANNLQNWPVLTSASSITTTTSIGLTLESAPNTQFTIRFYHSASCDPTGNGEGETPFTATVNVTTNGAGVSGTVSALMPQAVSSLRFITATATDPNSNTSEFSNCIQVPALIVDTTVDSGAMTACTVVFTDCSLRGAIANANAASDADVIQFAIGSGAQTISPTLTLPTITQPVTIDGTSQPGFATTPIIQLNGTGAGVATGGLTITGGGSTIRGLVINRFTGDGIAISTGGGNTIAGNYIGTNNAGSAALANNFGITILNSPNNTIGGLDAEDRNLISGNTLGGIEINLAPSTGNVVLGNLIGTDAAGTGALGNNDGVRIVSAPGNTVGGLSSSARNVISGNGRDGIRILSGGADNNSVVGNYIGTNAAGTAGLANGSLGVLISGAAGNSVGGTATGARNVISGNHIGISVFGSGNTVRGNLIGTDATGTADLGNALEGMLIGGPGNVIGGNTASARNVISGNGLTGVSITNAGTNDNVLQGNFIGTKQDGISPLGNDSHGIQISGGSNNVIGGDGVGEANVIAFNASSGVRVVSATGNTIAGNSIHSNGELGIDMFPDGVTPNDGGDADTGANNLQNFPVFTSAGLASGLVAINGSLNTAANTQFTMRIYVNTACDSSGNGEGDQQVESTVTTTNASGNSTFAFFLDTTPVSGTFITATATNPNGNTSEFSPCVPVLDDADDDNDGYTDDVEFGAPLCTGSVNDDGPPVSVDSLVNDGCPAVGPAEANCADSVDNDGDGRINDGCVQFGTFSEAQFKIGTGPQDACGNDGWGSNLFDNAGGAIPTVNELTIQDVLSFVAPVRHFGTSPPNALFSSRWDLLPGPGGLGDFINIQDLTTLFAGVQGSPGFPPMLGGARAFGLTCPWAP